MNKFITLIISFCITIFILFIYSVFYGSDIQQIYFKNDYRKKDDLYSYSIVDRLIYNFAGVQLYQESINKHIAKVPLTPLISRVVPILADENLKIPTRLEYTRITDIFEQGDCGSCWVFATCAMLSDRLYINNNINKNLSTQQILNCFEPSSGCDGNSPEKLLLWLSDTKYKISIEQEIPYVQKYDISIVQKCKEITHGVAVDKDSIKSITYFIDEINPDNVILAKNILQMKLELLLYGPFWAAMTIYDDFYTFTGDGVYIHSREAGNLFSGGHAIEVIGFSDYGKNRYWICRSSWVENWPLEYSNGIFKIIMGINECGIESRCGSASPIYSTGTTPSPSRLDISNYRTIKY